LTINLLRFRLISFYTLSLFCPSVVTFSLLSGLLDKLGSNSVHVSDAFLGQRFAHSNVLGLLVSVLELVLNDANETSLLKLCKGVADVFTSSITSVFGVGSVSLVATIVLAESVDSDLSSHVDLVGDGGGAVVEPVTVDGRELFSAGGLDVSSPL